MSKSKNLKSTTYLLGRLRDARMGAVLTQLELAKKADVSAVYLSRLERLNQRCGPVTLRKLAAALNVLPLSLVQESPAEAASA